MQTPVCALSLQPCHLVCTHSQCTRMPFICKACSEDECSALHSHGEQSEIVVTRWQSISTILEQINCQPALETQSVDALLTQIMTKLQSISSCYHSAAKRLQSQLCLRPQISNILQKLNKHNSSLTKDCISGAEVKLLRDSFVKKDYYANLQQIQEHMDKYTCEITQVFSSLLNISTALQSAVLEKQRAAEKQLQLRIIRSRLPDFKLPELQKLCQQIQRYASDATVHFNRGLFYFDNGEHEAAKDDFNSALAIHPGHSASLFYLGLIHHEQNQFHEAVHFYRKSISSEVEVQPPPPGCSFFRKSIDSFYKKATNIYSSITPRRTTHSTNSHSQAPLSEEDIDNNITSRSFNTPSKLASAYNNLGVIFHNQLGKPGEAVEYFTKAIQLNSTEPAYYSHRAVCFAALGDKFKADSDRLKILKLTQRQRTASLASRKSEL